MRGHRVTKVEAAVFAVLAVAAAVAIGNAATAAVDDTGPAADSQAVGELQEVVVTAQRREQRLQDVGVSVAAIGADQLHDMSITDSRDISKAVPGVLLTGFSSGQDDANLTLRGVSQGD